MSDIRGHTKKKRSGAGRGKPAGPRPGGEIPTERDALASPGPKGLSSRVHGAPGAELDDVRFREFAELLSAAVFEADTEGRITYANERAAACFGYTQADLERGLYIMDTIAPRDRKRAGEVLVGVLRGKPSHGNEYLALRKDGSTFPISAYSSTMVHDGRLVGMRGVVLDLGERKRAERALQESEERFRNIIEKSTNFFYIHDSEHVLTYLSPQVEEILGYRPAEALVRWTDVTSDNPANKIAFERTQRAIDTGTRQPPYEMEVIAQDGRLVWLEIHEAPLVKDGRTVAIVGAAQDITERKAAVEALRERQARLDSIFKVAPVGIGTVTDRVIIEVNDKVCEMTGYSREELVGKSARVLYATEQEYDYVGHEKYRQIREAGVGSVETRWRRKDGSLLDILLRSAALVPGDLSLGVTFTALDITEWRRSETALRESERKHRELIEMLQEGIWAIDREGRTTFANQAMARMLGYETEEMLERHLFSFMAEEHIPECRMYIERRERGAKEQHDFEFLRKNGDRINVSLSVAPIFDEYGSYAGAIAGVRDNTERLRAEEERRRLELQMLQTQKLESLGVLAGGIAHDFNNLLQAIHGNLDMALATLPPDAQARGHLAELEQASRRAADLCRQLLTYSGGGRFAVGPVSLEKMVEQMVQMLAVSISKKAVLRMEIAPGLPFIQGDETQIRQVLMNLVLNASEALGEESGEIIVKVDAVECTRAELHRAVLGDGLPEGRYLCLEVADTGCGMDRETQHKMFDPFFSTKFTGRGLGLASVLGIVRGHRGAMKIRSKKGEGTSFRILLPATDAPAPCPPEAPPAAERWCGSGVVLLADDEEMVRSVAKRMLERLGYRVLLASDGAEVVELYRSHTGEIDCVILDLTMPRRDGIEALDEIRAIGGEARIVLSSGYSEHELSRRYCDRGFSAFLEKPYDMLTLGEKLRKVLGSKVGSGIKG